MRRWLRSLRWTTCSACGTEFRKSKVIFPSLVGFSYCSAVCEQRVWAAWVRGAR